MKLDKRGSFRYKKVKRMKFVRKIVRNFTIGTIAIGIAFWMNNYNINKVNKIEPTASTMEQNIKVDDYNPSATSNQELNTNETLPDYIDEEDKLPTKEVLPPVEEPINEKIVDNSIPVKEQTNEVEQKQEKKMVALSFDDGPSKTLTPELLKILEDNDCTATFFVLGNRVKQYSDIIYEVYSAGNEIGNHSYDHSNFANLTEEEIVNQLSATNEAIYEVTNEYPTFFRPPYGSTTDKIKEAADCPLALWSIDSNDWRQISDEQVINNVISSLEDGKIILMHDIHKRTIEVSKILIPKIKDLGYEIVSIKELYEAKNIELEDGCVYSKAKKN